MSEYDQYKTLCDNCECVLAEDVNVECLARGDEEQTWCMECWNDLCEEMRAEGWVAQGDEDDVDEVDAPNHFPYKMCSECSERKSCGSYNRDMKWLCETCCAAQEHVCRACGETMTHARFEDGKMCCDAPLFEGDESESE
jgi:hypothetical protein